MFIGLRLGTSENGCPYMGRTEPLPKPTSDTSAGDRMMHALNHTSNTHAPDHIELSIYKYDSTCADWHLHSIVAFDLRCLPFLFAHSPKPGLTDEVIDLAHGQATS